MTHTKALLLFFALTGFLACKDKSCDDREYQAIKQVVIDHIPYQSGQILRFKTSTGEQFAATAERVFEVNKPDAPLICQEYLYVTLKSAGKLYAEYVKRGAVGADNLFQLSLYTLRTDGGDGVYIEVEDDGDMHSDDILTSSIQHDTLTIDGKLYEEVLDITFQENSIPEDVDLKKFFYNKTYGIIQYTTHNGVVTTRVD